MCRQDRGEGREKEGTEGEKPKAPNEILRPGAFKGSGFLNKCQEYPRAEMGFLHQRINKSGAIGMSELYLILLIGRRFFHGFSRENVMRSGSLGRPP